jgi:hypothetical protein
MHAAGFDHRQLYSDEAPQIARRYLKRSALGLCLYRRLMHDKFHY